MFDSIMPSFDVDTSSPDPFHLLRFGGEIMGVSEGSNPLTTTLLAPRSRAISFAAVFVQSQIQFQFFDRTKKGKRLDIYQDMAANRLFSTQKKNQRVEYVTLPFVVADDVKCCAFIPQSRNSALRRRLPRHKATTTFLVGDVSIWHT